MAKTIIGSYLSLEDAQHTVDAYELNKDQTKNLFFLTHINDFTHKTTSAMTDKIEHIFIYDDDLDDNMQKLIDFGLSKNDALKCIVDIKLGHTIIIADDQLSIGHQQPIESLSAARR